MIDYYFVKCVNDIRAADQLRKNTIYSTPSKVDDPNDWMIFIEELGSFWSRDRFEKVRVPNIDNLFKEVNSLFSDIDY